MKNMIFVKSNVMILLVVVINKYFNLADEIFVNVAILLLWLCW